MSLELCLVPNVVYLLHWCSFNGSAVLFWHSKVLIGDIACTTMPLDTTVVVPIPTSKTVTTLGIANDEQHWQHQVNNHRGAFNVDCHTFDMGIMTLLCHAQSQQDIIQLRVVVTDLFIRFDITGAAVCRLVLVGNEAHVPPCHVSVPCWFAEHAQCEGHRL